MKKEKVVIALGGNALGNNKKEQILALENAASSIVDLIEEGIDLVITHGNGPQVGMIQTAMDELSLKMPSYGKIPLTSSVAMSQGYIGMDLENAIRRQLSKRDIDKEVTTVLTQVEVLEDDKAFKNPSKPIGRFMDKAEAEKLEKDGFNLIEDSGRGYRIVVASPTPKKIVELKAIDNLLKAGHVVIACGGGGIPVINKDGNLNEVDAVIDKDNTSSLLARGLDADKLIILTAVEKVAINFGKTNEKWLDTLTIDQAKTYIEEGQFGKGSMEPKVAASLDFVNNTRGKEALITELKKVKEALAGKTGTRISNGD
ncbi:MAG: carbamate kinase [Tissierellia bacterium]|nr:carbamate kinase [Tissierellia bacterium]